MAALPLLMVTHVFTIDSNLELADSNRYPHYYVRKKIGPKNHSKCTSNLSSGGEEMNKGIGNKKKRRQEDKRRIYHL
ncbi:hypothetical protein L873DRAFT_1821356 [Choiromyces venosus 120613-1]|uniref:Uncharacterized protein n=1 Tax=Choiromyces venosus 120613-1 TaxID=1336337 RepID=A0A3N4IZ74_9PEZI|nr:hypothetical protein L873DRAFT_1821356 [Choiromyces venosus 120613-1]